MNTHPQPLLLFIFLLSPSISAVDLLFNGFNSSDLLLFGNATIDSRILTLTRNTSFTIGRALYSTKILTKDPNTSIVLPFSTSFIFSIAPLKGVLPGHGIVFIFIPFTGIQGSSSAQHLGLFNLTNNGDSNNHVLGIEFDVFKNQEFDDIDDNHVGVDVNSLKSVGAHRAGFWPDNSAAGDEESFEEVKLNNGKNYQVWIDYADSVINVTMAPVGKKKPRRPLLNFSLDLSDVFEDEMFIGFTGATGRLVEGHRILAWSFSNTNFSFMKLDYFWFAIICSTGKLN
ncbi:L-type lectin-domain containing receptor kinase VII.1-like, partial [Carica papaya]|uniref:L-type lectin-domain containing receptor kinase VII.1-like n=1 Tax=Carica papaya TaxID=3649 RepID=UPI000B8CCF9B